MSTPATHEPAPPAQGSFKKKVVSASLWSIAEYGFTMLLRVVSSMVLTHLLAPAYFGEIAIVTTLIVGINLLSDIGLAPSVIQSRRADDPLFLNTAWSVQVCRGVALWLASLVLCIPAAHFYHDPKLVPLLPVLALSTLISSFNGTSLLTLSRHMGVARLFLIDGSTAVVALAITIAWAFVHPSVWAIVAGQVLSSVYRLLLSHIHAVSGGIRNSFRWDKSSLHEVLHFGKWIMVSTAFYFFASQADKLVLGRLVPLATLGIYGLAYQISDIPRQILNALGNRVLFPAVAKMIHAPAHEFQARFFRFRGMALGASALLLALMVNFGGLLITFFYDRRYHEAAWMVPILALGLWQTLLYQTTYPVLLSLGKSKYGGIGNAAYAATMLGGIPLAFHFFGLVGGVAAVAAGDLPLYFIIQAGVTRQNIHPWRQDLLMTLLFAALTAGLHALKHLL